VQADDFGAFGFLGEMAGDSVLDQGAQVVPILALRENAVTQRTRPKTALLSFAHLKDELAHAPSFARGGDFGKGD
jgi:hypothetical protein